LVQNNLNIKFALLVPCYNAAAYIDPFLDNLSKLDTSFDEIIFYDDASTDNTYQLLLAKGNIVIRGAENKGPGYARNRLAEAASSPYIHFHDIDDEFNPRFLSLVNQKLEGYAYDVMLGYADWIDKTSREVLIKWRYSEQGIVNDPVNYFVSNPLGIINTVYRRSFFLQEKGFNEGIKCWEDADLHIRLAAAGARFAVIDEVLAYSIRHNNGISRNQQWCWQCRLKFMQLYLEKYRGVIDRDVFKAELKRIQTVFINMGLYDRLKQIIDLNKRYSLGIPTQKTAIIYYLNKIVPTPILQSTLQYFNGK
jgi:glycosyltransferase involved in cell wall biosynthesis